MSDFKTYDLKNSLKCSVSGLGNIKKRFLMVESCLEHISKLILVGKSMADRPNTEPKKGNVFQKMAMMNQSIQEDKL